MSRLEEEIYSEVLALAVSDMVAVSEEIRSCSQCEGSGHMVPGSGHPLADLFIIKGSPTPLEVERQVAISPSDIALLKDGFGDVLDVASVYGTLALKCSRTNGRSAIATCAGFLRDELEIVRPRFVLTMGAAPLRALGSLLADPKALPMRRGELKDVKFESGFEAAVLATFSPEKIENNPSLLSEFATDCRTLSAILEKS